MIDVLILVFLNEIPQFIDHVLSSFASCVRLIGKISFEVERREGDLRGFGNVNLSEEDGEHWYFIFQVPEQRAFISAVLIK